MRYVYIIKCLANNKVYVGQTSNFKHRVNSHRCDLRKGRGLQKLQVDWDLYGEDSFVFEELVQCGTKKQSNELEKLYIRQYDSINNGYNTNPGGVGQGNFNYLNGMYGKHHTEQSKELMSKNRKGLTAGKNNPNYGNHSNAKYTEEVRRKMSESQKKRWQKRKGLL